MTHVLIYMRIKRLYSSLFGHLTFLEHVMVFLENRSLKKGKQNIRVILEIF